MYPFERFADICDLELFLFNGVPDVAEQMYELPFQSYSEIRTTRNSIKGTNGQRTINPNGAKVCTFQLDIETGDYVLIEDD